MLVISVGGTLTGDPQRLFQPSFYERSAADRAADAAVAMVAPGAPVAASNALLSRLTDRHGIYDLSPRGVKRARWLVVTAHDSGPVDARAWKLTGWNAVYTRDGTAVLVSSRRP
jgi:hypothetical protein